MKNIIVVLMLTMIVERSGAQQTEVSIEKPQVDYLKKSKRQRNTGLLLLGSGVTMFAGATIAMQHSNSKGENEFAFLLGGLASTIASVPFFISAGINKHKANLQMRREAFMILPGYHFENSFTSISLNIDIGKN